MDVPGVGIVAGNGYFIKTRETKKMPATWIDMVANRNFTWKEPCIEIFNYVRPPILLIPFALDSPLLSPPNASRARLPKNATSRSCGVSGPDRRTTVLIANERVVKRRTVSRGAGRIADHPEC